jgi:DNA processing protein
MIATDELSAWLRLLETPGVGRTTARKLLAAFGSPQAVWAAPRGARAAVVGPVVADALGTEPPGCAELVAATVAWLTDPAADGQRHVITLGDNAYPNALLSQADPPLLLYAHGRLALLQAQAIAVVGSRHATAQGLDNARAFAAHLSQAGLTVVSGLALGVDGAAHEGALTGPGSTIAVVGTGLDRIYPSRHRNLTHRIAREGLLLSEFPIGTEPLAAHFPQRNRIIAGLSLGTLVVEAAVQSGSLITARMALEGGREVFAIPGSIHAPQSRGCHALIRQGAKLVECGQDILEELQLSARPGPVDPADAEREGLSDEADASQGGPHAALLYALGLDPVSLDALAARTGWPTSQLNIELLDLELQGQVARLPGQLFQRRMAG